MHYEALKDEQLSDRQASRIVRSIPFIPREHPPRHGASLDRIDLEKSLMFRLMTLSQSSVDISLILRKLSPETVKSRVLEVMGSYKIFRSDRPASNELATP